MTLPDMFVAATVAAALAAALQVLLARWRDLGTSTVALGGAAFCLGGSSGVEAVAVAIGVALASAVGTWRSSRAGVARPELTSAIAALAVAVGLGGAWLPSEGLRVGAVGALLLCGAVALGSSIARLGARPVRVRWVGEIPVSGPEERR
ncbi:MAG: hypothetical protein KC621_32360 [Myxococcales bacterium]|nr:hypothetical protein [Myxococcales bacterium]